MVCSHLPYMPVGDTLPAHYNAPAFAVAGLPCAATGHCVTPTRIATFIYHPLRRYRAPDLIPPSFPGWLPHTCYLHRTHYGSATVPPPHRTATLPALPTQHLRFVAPDATWMDTLHPNSPAYLRNAWFSRPIPTCLQHACQPGLFQLRLRNLPVVLPLRLLTTLPVPTVSQHLRCRAPTYHASSYYPTFRFCTRLFLFTPVGCYCLFTVLITPDIRCLTVYNIPGGLPADLPYDYLRVERALPYLVLPTAGYRRFHYYSSGGLLVPLPLFVWCRSLLRCFRWCCFYRSTGVTQIAVDLPLTLPGLPYVLDHLPLAFTYALPPFTLLFLLQCIIPFLLFWGVAYDFVAVAGYLAALPSSVGRHYRWASSITPITVVVIAVTELLLFRCSTGGCSVTITVTACPAFTTPAIATALAFRCVVTLCLPGIVAITGDYITCHVTATLQSRCSTCR